MIRTCPKCGHKHENLTGKISSCGYQMGTGNWNKGYFVCEACGEHFDHWEWSETAKRRPPNGLVPDCIWKDEQASPARKVVDREMRPLMSSVLRYDDDAAWSRIMINGMSREGRRG